MISPDSMVYWWSKKSKNQNLNIVILIADKAFVNVLLQVFKNEYQNINFFLGGLKVT